LAVLVAGAMERLPVIVREPLLAFTNVNVPALFPLNVNDLIVVDPVVLVIDA
jgi:hypothetical protein